MFMHLQTTKEREVLVAQTDLNCLSGQRNTGLWKAGLLSQSRPRPCSRLPVRLLKLHIVLIITVKVSSKLTIAQLRVLVVVFCLQK